MDYFEKEYDESSPGSIEKYAQKMIGCTFLDVSSKFMRKTLQIQEESRYDEEHENKRRKGGLGELIEERFFHYKSNNDSNPDFHKAGVELKVTPYRINKNGSYAAKERLIITMIDYFAVCNEEFETSHLWRKGNLILLVFYLYQEEITNRLNYRINFAKLFTPPKEDIEIIRLDFAFIVDKIKAGKAHELSESDTLYLGAAPKAATSKDRRKQPFSNELAKPRAFAFKNSYMTYVLNNYIISGKESYESIINEKLEQTFEQYVVLKIMDYKGKAFSELIHMFQYNIKKRTKSMGAILAYRMLGIRGNHAAEFEKANIVVKTIRIGFNNKIRESMSFPTFEFKKLIEETWIDSTFGNYLSATKFLFVIYKYDENGGLWLKGCQFWNMPYKDLNEDVYAVWEKTRQVISEGLIIHKRNGKNYNNFPKASENPVCHVRPHAKDANDTYDLPDGRKYPKQSFWLNNTYILKQIKNEFLI